MTGPETPQQPQASPQPSPERDPDQLDVLALTLVGLTHQLQAVGGAVRTALLQVNMLQAQRDGTTAQQQARRVMGRADLGFTGPGPQQGAPGWSEAGPGGRPLPAHPDRTFMAKRRQEQQQQQPADAAAEDSTTDSTTESPT